MFLIQTKVDRERARKLGVPGGDIMIHGMTNGLGWLGSMHRTMDWTSGYIAVTDAEMDEIWPQQVASPQGMEGGSTGGTKVTNEGHF